MIEFYSGTPGSGKSLHAARELLDAVRSGYPVIVNFPVALDKLPKKCRSLVQYVPNRFLTPDMLIAFAREHWRGKLVKEDRILLIVDEAQRVFNSRSWDAKNRAGWIDFLSEHRHYGYRIIMVAQFDRQIDRQIRCLFEYDVSHRKASRCGLAGFFLSLLASGKLFCAVRYWYQQKDRLDAEWFTAKKRYYQLYDTFADFAVPPPPPSQTGDKV